MAAPTRRPAFNGFELFDDMRISFCVLTPGQRNGVSHPHRTRELDEAAIVVERISYSVAVMTILPRPSAFSRYRNASAVALSANVLPMAGVRRPASANAFSSSR